MYYSDQNDVRTTSIQYYSVLQSTTPVLLRTTKYYLVLLQYYSVLQSTTPVLESITLYYKVLLQYYSVLQTYYSSTTPYYKVLLQYYKVLLQYYFDRNDVRTTSIQYYSVLQSTTPVLLRTTKYYLVLQSTTPVLLRTTNVLQSTSPVLQSTTPCTTPVLLRTTNVLLCTTKYYSDRNDVRTTSIQYYSVLQSSTKASKTSISCEASSTFQGTSFQNEHFVRGFLNFSKNKLPKRAFRARLPQLFKEQASKTSISCETSATFQGTSFQNEYFVCETSSTFQGTSFQNEHFVRDFLNFSIKELPKSCACHAKRENDLSP